jgi:hypothetical protein
MSIANLSDRRLNLNWRGKKVRQKHLISYNTNTFSGVPDTFTLKESLETLQIHNKTNQSCAIERTKRPYYYTSRLNAYVSVGRDSGVKARDC